MQHLPVSINSHANYNVIRSSFEGVPSRLLKTHHVTFEDLIFLKFFISMTTIDTILYVENQIEQVRDGQVLDVNVHSVAHILLGTMIRFESFQLVITIPNGQ